MSLTKKYIEKKYGAQLSKTTGFDDNRQYWECWLGDEYVDGWTLAEIVEKLECIKEEQS
jgi:hypothetical protein